ncbi:YciI family protein [Marinilabilia sp.]|jgi:uncharacterized protein YciI
MYIILIHYRRSDSQINFHKETHQKFLQEQISEGNFMTAGMRSPRNGEVILSCIDDLETLQVLLSEDPYYRYRIGQYEIIEFTPDLSCLQMHEFMDQKAGNC